MENPFPNTKPLREKELREAAICAKCGKKIGETGIPLFYLVTIERHGVDRKAILRQAGLEALVGSVMIAQALSPNDDMTEPIMERGTITICEPCAGHEMMVHELAELVNKKMEAKKLQL